MAGEGGSERERERERQVEKPGLMPCFFSLCIIYIKKAVGKFPLFFRREDALNFDKLPKMNVKKIHTIKFATHSERDKNALEKSYTLIKTFLLLKLTFIMNKPMQMEN